MDIFATRNLFDWNLMANYCVLLLLTAEGFLTAYNSKGSRKWWISILLLSPVALTQSDILGHIGVIITFLITGVVGACLSVSIRNRRLFLSTLFIAIVMLWTGINIYLLAMREIPTP